MTTCTVCNSVLDDNLYHPREICHSIRDKKKNEDAAKADFLAFRRKVALALIMRGEHTHLGHECLWDKASGIARAEPKE